LDRFHWFARFSIYLIGHKPLQGPDIDRLLYMAAIAGCLTAMVANAPADAREGIVHLNHPQRIIPAPFPNQSDVPLGALTRWAGIPARGNALLLDRIRIWDSLWIELKNCSTLVKAFVKLIRHNHRTNSRTFPTANTFRGIDVASLMLQSNAEIPSLSLYS
jgi:hypothetical protein